MCRVKSFHIERFILDKYILLPWQYFQNLKCPVASESDIKYIFLMHT